jgi:hypothetical protein
VQHRHDPSDHDAGWGAQEITLIGDQGETLRLPCRWIEYSHAGKGKTAAAFFVVSTDNEAQLGNDDDWRVLSFKDGAGNAHSYAVKDAEVASPMKIRLTKVARI